MKFIIMTIMAIALMATPAKAGTVFEVPMDDGGVFYFGDNECNLMEVDGKEKLRVFFVTRGRDNKVIGAGCWGVNGRNVAIFALNGEMFVIGLAGLVEFMTPEWKEKLESLEE